MRSQLTPNDKIIILLGRKVDLVEDGQLMSFAQPSAEKDKILIYERKDNIL